MRPSPSVRERGGGEGGRVASTRRLYFVDARALTPTLSRKREREYPIGIGKDCGISLCP
ncbi:hypothetical protein CBM2623_B20115 [Cupriavidus taiwanensis]|nr:hypothetical protein CBM2608_B20116 [Cupriavidus taiwanensis]SPA34203.1 hypothetical protein CBM2623_B20115 [Cupriavidus taiwanensis]